MFLNKRQQKRLIYTVEATLCCSFFQANINKSHNKNDTPFSSIRSKTSDGKTLKQYPQCKNTVLKNMDPNWKVLWEEISKS